MKTLFLAPLLALAMTTAPLAVAENQPPAPPQPSEPTYVKDVEPLFIEKCGSCHGTSRQKGGLDLSAGKGFKALVGVASDVKSDFLRVKPGSSESSLLWLKLDFRSPAGDPMPKRFLFGPKKLPQKELDLVKAWIDAGAKE